MSDIEVSENGGPFLNAALICERVLIEADNTVSVIRIIDYFPVVVPRSKVNQSMINVEAYLYISFRSGGFKGESVIRVDQIQPNGTRYTGDPRLVEFRGHESSSAVLIVSLAFGSMSTGTFWFEILRDDQPVTRVPVVFEIQVVDDPSGESELLAPVDPTAPE